MDARVLIVGTTPDYVQWIENICGKKVFFLTDLLLRKLAREATPDPDAEVCWDLSDFKGSLQALEQHLKRFSIKTCGIASFDCESMELASTIAQKFNLFFQSSEAIIKSRDKFASKRAWELSGLNIPKYALLSSLKEAEDFYKKIEAICVLKPLSGAGSELVFMCETSSEVRESFSKIKTGLKSKKGNRLYNSESILNRHSILAEEFIEGTEYSCDFVIENGSSRIIRLTEKIKLKSLPFGIIAGYRLIDKIPKISHDNLVKTITKAAESIGINGTICMLDFIVKEGQIFLIEIAPRPGGDCLPLLLLCASKQNILEMNINLASGEKIDPADYRKIEKLTALRIFAEKNGVLKNIDASELKKETVIIEVNLNANIGMEIKLPPEDYDSWILGNYIFKFEGHSNGLAKVYNYFKHKLKISINEN